MYVDFDVDFPDEFFKPQVAGRVYRPAGSHPRDLAHGRVSALFLARRPLNCYSGPRSDPSDSPDRTNRSDLPLRLTRRPIFGTMNSS
jgi:hypothetical protein